VKVLHVVGTRPNFMKVAPVMGALRDVPDLRQVLVHTGQHYDASMSDTFLEDLDLPRPDHFLGAGSGTHAEQTARVMIALEPVLAAESPDLVLVAGDVNSTLAAALTAAKVGIPVAHLEAGLRSWDRSMPEEHNRVLTDHLAELLLTPTRSADENLVNEGIARDKIKFVGNTMIDSLRAHEAAARDLGVAAELEVEDFLLVTLHRPALVDHPARFEPVLKTLEEIAQDRPVIYPIHPRSHQRLEETGWQPQRVRLLQPQSYLRFLSLLLDAHAVVTDSGGIQEETTVLGIPCFTLRDNTERPITVKLGTNTVLGIDGAGLRKLLDLLHGSRPSEPVAIEGWDGRAALRVKDAITSRSHRLKSVD
jgi:UDP-N-acetylglucosamine 2-epimerase (non-hydrolysing)